MSKEHLRSLLESMGESEELKLPSKDELKRRAKWLGKVVTPKSGRRRYVVTQAHFFGIRNDDKGSLGYTICAIEGGDKGSHDTNTHEDNIDSYWKVDSSQEIVFRGKEAHRRKRQYDHDTQKGNEYGPKVYDAGSQGKHVIAFIVADNKPGKIEEGYYDPMSEHPDYADRRTDAQKQKDKAELDRRIASRKAEIAAKAAREKADKEAQKAAHDRVMKQGGFLKLLMTTGSKKENFNPSDHPRANDGKFTAGSGGGRVPSASSDRGAFKSHKFQQGDEWDSPEGKKKVVGIQGDKAMVQTGSNPFKALVPLSQLGDDVYRDVKNHASRAKASSAQASQKAADDAASSLGGYEKGLSSMALGTAKKALNRTVSADGKVIKLKDLIQSKVKDGFKVRGDRLEHPDGRFLDKRVLGVHGLGYANSLKEAVSAKSLARVAAKETWNIMNLANAPSPNWSSIESLWKMVIGWMLQADLSGAQGNNMKMAISDGIRSKNAKKVKDNAYDLATWLEKIGPGLTENKSFSDYDDAYEFARKQATEIKHDYGIEKMKQYGKTVYIVKMLPPPDKSFGHELRMQRVRPGEPKAVRKSQMEATLKPSEDADMIRQRAEKLGFKDVKVTVTPEGIQFNARKAPSEHANVRNFQTRMRDSFEGDYAIRFIGDTSATFAIKAKKGAPVYGESSSSRWWVSVWDDLSLMAKAPYDDKEEALKHAKTRTQSAGRSTSVYVGPREPTYRDAADNYREERDVVRVRDIHEATSPPRKGTVLKFKDQDGVVKKAKFDRVTDLSTLGGDKAPVSWRVYVQQPEGLDYARYIDPASVVECVTEAKPFDYESKVQGPDGKMYRVFTYVDSDGNRKHPDEATHVNVKTDDASRRTFRFAIKDLKKVTEAAPPHTQTGVHDWKKLAQRLLDADSGKPDQESFGYRAFLRAVVAGQTTKHLTQMPDDRGKGATRARQALIDLGGVQFEAFQGSVKRADGRTVKAVVPTKGKYREGDIVKARGTTWRVIDRSDDEAQSVWAVRKDNPDKDAILRYSEIHESVTEAGPPGDVAPWVFTKYEDAYKAAKERAKRMGIDNGIEKANEFGKTVFRVKLLPRPDRSFGHELRMQRVSAHESVTEATGVVDVDMLRRECNDIIRKEALDMTREPVMEPGFVKTPEDEADWKKAKDLARKSSPDDYYALANHIFHNIKGARSKNG